MQVYINIKAVVDIPDMETTDKRFEESIEGKLHTIKTIKVNRWWWETTDKLLKDDKLKKE